MTSELRESQSDSTAPAPLPAPRNQGQWALIWREFRRRRLAMLSGGVILFLITSAIFAPFLANDRPVFYRGFNRFEYRQSLRTLGIVVRQLARRSADDGKSQTAISNPEEVIRLHIEAMSAVVTDETAGELQLVQNDLLRLAGTPADKSTAAELSKLRIDLRRRFDDEQVQFVSAGYWPVVATLTWLDVSFMVFNILLLTVGLWRMFFRLVVSRDRPQVLNRLTWAAFLLLPAVSGLLWWSLVPERVDRTNYKAGVFAGIDDAEKAPVVYESVTWPIVPYGLDEDDLDAKNARPPFWPKKEGDEELDASDEPANAWDQPHWLGADDIGRDVLCRMIWGGRVSLSVGIVAVSIYVTLGIIIGSIAGYFRGIPDLLISRIIEIVICFPSFFLILTVVAFVGPSIFNIMVVIGVIGWTGVARLVRGEFLRLGEQEFVLAARALGYSPWRIIFRHVLPNAMAPVLVSATFGVAGAILTESGLSFLGFGVTIPTPSWGSILAAGRQSVNIAPWLITLPGFAIFLTITAYNLVGEAFRDAADPRLRGQHIRQ